MAIAFAQGEIMGEADLYDDFPDDPEEAFFYLEESFQNKCERSVSMADSDDRIDIFYIEYISKVLAAVRELGNDAVFAGRVVPAIV